MKRSTIRGFANLKLLLGLLLIALGFLPMRATGQTIDFQQAQNGDPTSFPITFTNGILNATQTTYFEGVGIPQRLIFTGLKPNTVYTMHFNFLAGIPSKNVHAFDFLMSWEQAVETAKRIGGAFDGQFTENELKNLFSTACQNAPAACTGLDGSLPSANVYRPKVPDMDDPVTGTVPAFYSEVQGNIDCFEGANGSNYGDRDIELRSDGAIDAASVQFVFLGYDKNYARFELKWKSAGTQMMIRYASRPAVGNGGGGNFACGYGINEGAGAISGGNYHNIFEELLEANGRNSVIQGSRDNQLMSGAITPVDQPTCPTLASQTACETVTELNYSLQQETGVTYTWTLTNGTPGANAKLDGTAPITGTSVKVVPIDNTGFTPGTFSLTITATKEGAAPRVCEFPGIGTIIATPDKPSVCEIPASVCPQTGITAGKVLIKVSNLQANAYYVLTQGTDVQTKQAPATVTTESFLSFEVDPGESFTVHGETRGTDGTTVLCTGEAADCDDITTCPAPASGITRKATTPTEEVQKAQRVHDINARIGGATKVMATPNPFTDKVRFTLQSEVSGQGSLEIYNTVGQKVATVYQGHVEAGRVLNKEYLVPASQRQNLIYIFRVGEQKTTGKLLNW